MIKLKKPEIDQTSILDDCLESMREGDRKEKLKNSKSEIVNVGKKYDLLAKNGKLLCLESTKMSNAGANKDDLIFLYDDKFSKKGQIARKYYDELMLLAPYGRCPQCGQRQVRTLDHYLPKSKYPMLSVVPYNLIPSCSDCNKDKLDEVAQIHEQETIHPYYDDFNDEIWIKALIIEEEPISFNFYTEKPESWSEEKYSRAKNHFKVFGLNKLYKPYAAELFVSEIKWIKRVFNRCGEEIAKQEIFERISDEQVLRKNNWKAAFYNAIYLNEWFWKEYIINYE